MDPADELLIEHHVLVPSDGAFQRQARLLQARWRERHGHPVGLHRGRPLGSRLAMPFAKETLANYLTPTIRDVVRAEVLDPMKSMDKLYREPRIFEDLLSSQPLCFNLFGELQRDLALASRVFEEVLDVWPIPGAGVRRRLLLFRRVGLARLRRGTRRARSLLAAASTVQLALIERNC